MHGEPPPLRLPFSLVLAPFICIISDSARHHLRQSARPRHCYSTSLRLTLCCHYCCCCCCRCCARARCACIDSAPTSPPSISYVGSRCTRQSAAEHGHVSVPLSIYHPTQHNLSNHSHPSIPRHLPRMCPRCLSPGLMPRCPLAMVTFRLAAPALLSHHHFRNGARYTAAIIYIAAHARSSSFESRSSLA